MPLLWLSVSPVSGSCKSFATSAVGLGQLFDDEEDWTIDPSTDSTDDAMLSFDRYVREGIDLLEDWLRAAE
jgi:hypothetical protein